MILWAYSRKDEETMKKLKKLMALLCLMFCFSALGVSTFSDVNTVYAATPDPNEGEGDEDEGEGKSGDELLQEGKEKFEDEDSNTQKITEMTGKVKPENNDLSTIIGMPIETLLNTLIYVLLTVANIWFFLQTCIDLVFLLSPAFRGMLSASGGEDHEKLKGIACGLVSEQALKACGCKREKVDDKKHIDSDGFSDEVKWSEWVTGRLIMFVCILSYLALLLMGLLPTLVKFLSSFAYAVLKAIMGVFGFEPE